MALRIISPRNSFVQFNESSFLQSCEFPTSLLTLPVFDDDDVWFQFIIETDSENEADALCDLHNEQIILGITQACAEDRILDFPFKPERYRLDTTHILYNWMHGLPGFATVISVGNCFFIKITVQGIYTIFDFCSNAFQRIDQTCHTSVIEYGNEDNDYGFNYCGGQTIESDSTVACEPLFVEFTNQSSLSIPYTTELLSKYGQIPNVQVWVYNENNELTNMGIVYTFDNFPPSKIDFDFGGYATGVIKIN